MQSKDAPNTLDLLKKIEARNPEEVKQETSDYLDHFKNENNNNTTESKSDKSCVDMTNRYFNLATDFYEWGWGEGFHFARLEKGRTREVAFARQEYYMAMKLRLDPKDKIMDCGCGIGGPARNIASFAEVNITGININEYQLERAKILTEKRNMQDQVTYRKEDFTQMTIEDETYDKVYAIEATCHSPSLQAVYGEIFRVLKPGGLFGCYEWALTDKFDPSNKYHLKLKEDILVGDGLPALRTMSEIKQTIRDVGYNLLEIKDMNVGADVPWYEVFSPTSEFRISTTLQRYMTTATLTALEMVKAVPKGSVTVHKTLCQGADALYAAGKEGIFTPMYFFMVQKPEK